ncbi:hypothetical protein [Nocardioides taihuensis]|uniref:Restriction endonuclease n=1 Tax=Nocardioides taihuensis TaxID=1835606 RepID=A0ABW0BRC3_9ACTN
MVEIDAVVHPQAVVVGYEEDDPRLHTMRSMVEGTLVLTESDDLTGHRELDWDLWVQRGPGVGDSSQFLGSQASPPEHMHALTFGVERFSMIARQGGGCSLRYGSTNHGRTMRVADNLPSEVARLVRHELVPALQDRASRPFLVVPGRGTYNARDEPVRLREDLEDLMVPFLFDADGNVIAGAFRKYSRLERHQSVVWMLPHDSPHPELWLAAAMREWHELTPDRLPFAVSWSSRSAWQTPEEADAVTRLALLERRREEWEADYVRERKALEAHAQSARARADAGLRRLITSKGEDLVDGVTEAITDLGFTAIDEDARRSSEGRARAHDLTLEDPDHQGEVILVEVKGDAKGGGGSITQAQRHQLRYAVEHAGDSPARCWLILNHFAEQDPDERPEVLQGADVDIALFAEDGGLLIDSRTLFALAIRVRTGAMTASEARAVMWAARGRLSPSFDASATHRGETP